MFLAGIFCEVDAIGDASMSEVGKLIIRQMR